METYAIIITGKSELVNLFCAILSEKYIVELYRNSHDTKYQLFDQMNEENKVVFKIFMSAVNRLSDDISFIKDERGYKKCYKIYFSYDYNIHVSPSGYDFYMYWFDDCLMKDIRNNVEVIANKILNKEENSEKLPELDKENWLQLPIAQNIFDVDFLIKDAAEYFDIPKDTIIIGYGYPKIHAGSIGINLFISIGSNSYIDIPTISYYKIEDHTKLIESKYDGTYTTTISEWVEQEYQPTLPEYESEL